MVDTSKILTDDHEDEVFNILRDMDEITGWKKEKVLLKEKLLKLLKKKRYISFWASNPRTYRLGQIGDSYLYDVPLYTQGHLKKFKGYRVRVLCTGSSSHSWREISVGKLYKTPENLLIRNSRKIYTFPLYIKNHTVIYKSPRFALIKIKGDFDYSLKDPYIKADSIEGWDWLLLDGKSSSAIGTVRKISENSFEGKVLSWKGWTEEKSIRSIINHISKYSSISF